MPNINADSAAGSAWLLKNMDQTKTENQGIE